MNESRVSQLHARAIKRLRTVLADMAPAEAMTALKSAVLTFHQKPVMAKAALPASRVATPEMPAAAAVAMVAKSTPVVAFKTARANVRQPFMAPRRVASVRVAVAAAR